MDFCEFTALGGFSYWEDRTMLIRIKNIMANPYRKIKAYPIDRSKINSLKISIKDTSFWDNILVRQHPKKKGKYQLAYGHHRYIALGELGIKEIDIPVRKLTDAMMVKIMAEENLNWSTSPTVIVQTVDATRKFLDGEFAKYKTFKQLPPDLMNSLEQKTEKSFNKIKAGVGSPTIKKFLGNNWTKSRIQEALAILDDKELYQEAIKDIPTMYQAGEFRKAVKTYHVPKAKQKELAKKIVKEKTHGEEIHKIVRKASTKKSAIDPVLTKLENTFDDIDKYSTTLRHKIISFRMQIEELKVTQIEGAKASITLISLLELRKEIDILLEVKQIKQIEEK